MTNEKFLKIMQGWQRRLLREGKHPRLSITVFEDSEIMVTAWDGEKFCTETACPPGDVLEHHNEQNAKRIEQFLTDKIK